MNTTVNTSPLRRYQPGGAFITLLFAFDIHPSFLRASLAAQILVLEKGIKQKETKSLIAMISKISPFIPLPSQIAISFGKQKQEACMAGSRGVVYVEQGKVEVQNIANPRLEGPDGKALVHGAWDNSKSCIN